MRIAAFTGSVTASSRRFRLLQYLGCLSNFGIQVDEFVANFGSWPPSNRYQRPFWLLATLADRVVPVLESRRYDLTFLQRELISTLYTLERFTGRPRVLDIDDAVWLGGQRAKRSVSALARGSDAIICGNNYIAETVSRWNRQTVVLPTAVDTERFFIQRRIFDGTKIIGWSGSYSGLKYLLEIERPLLQVLEARPNAVLRVVSDLRPRFRFIPNDRVEFLQWSPENEAITIQEMDIGLMPLDDTEWVLGKCSYKMLLYMSCGVPVVVSPYGMNREILALGNIGLAPIQLDAWRDSIINLLDNDKERIELGDSGRMVVEEHYSLDRIGSSLAKFISSFE